MKRIIENYCGVKTKLKRWEIQHGWTPLDGALAVDLERDLDLMLCWNKRFQEDWVQKSKVPCEIITAPFVIYRRENKIERSKDAKGTLAYPAHSIKGKKAQYDIDKYCELLRSLPEEFQPVTISLHHSDIDEYNMDKEYEKRGLKTVCASYGQGDKQFYEAFYDILKNFRYTTSNEPGSYSFYSVEMGIPFFILGEPSVTDNSQGADKNVEAKKNMSILDYKYGKIAFDLFSHKPYGEITQEQKDFVYSELGLNNSLNKEELKKVLNKVKKWF
ncbi:hypothetical protein IKQ26_10305 [bacterium]|nr:hypothetical protein [bacterium]